MTESGFGRIFRRWVGSSPQGQADISPGKTGSAEAGWRPGEVSAEDQIDAAVKRLALKIQQRMRKDA